MAAKRAAVVEKSVPQANAFSKPSITADDVDDRAAIIKQLQQLTLKDDSNFTKSKHLREF